MNNLISGSYATNIRNALMTTSDIIEKVFSLSEGFFTSVPSGLKNLYSGIVGPYVLVSIKGEYLMALFSICLSLLNQVGTNQYVANIPKNPKPHKIIDSVSITSDKNEIIPTPAATDFKITIRSLLKNLCIISFRLLSYIQGIIVTQKSLKVSIIITFILSFTHSFSASASEECLLAITKYEKLYKIPTGLLKAISKVESEYNHLALNDGLKQHNFKNTQEVLDRISYLKNIGKTNFDIGCMQINYYWHGKSFASVKEMLEVNSNVRYAASIIHGLYKTHGNWQTAVRYYHSYEPKFYQIYSRKIALAWLQEK